MKEINEIRSQIFSRKRSLIDAEARLEAAGLRYLGLKVGDRIIVSKKGGEFEAAVVGSCVPGYGRPRPVAVKVKRDGTVGNASAGYIDENGWRRK